MLSIYWDSGWNNGGFEGSVAQKVVDMVPSNSEASSRDMELDGSLMDHMQGVQVLNVQLNNAAFVIP